MDIRTAESPRNTMELSEKFKMAYYLMKNRELFDNLVASLKEYKNLPEDVNRQDIARVLRKYNEAAFGKHPEILIHMMYSCLLRDVAWNLLVHMLKTLRSDFQLTALDAHIETLSAYGHGNRKNLHMTMLDILERLTIADVTRVKLLLSWKIIEGHEGLKYGRLETMNIYDLAHYIVQVYSVRAVRAMSLILAQIEQMDLVVTLSKATR